MSTTRQPSAELLLEHQSWIRELARHLVRDPHAAEDLVQETCMVALERPPLDGSKLKRWLASVMRNLVRQRVRGDGRRELREEGRARPERLESTERMVERVALQRELVEDVLQLPEPFRSTLLHRFFEGHAPAVIARAQGVSVATVQSRITRGLARLRSRLDAGHERRTWAGLLLALPAASLSAPVAPVLPGVGQGSAELATMGLGGLAMNTKVVLAGIALVAAGTLVAVRGLREAEPSGPPRAEVAALSAAARLEDPGVVDTLESAPPDEADASRARRSVVPASNDNPQTPVTSPASVPVRDVRGRVLGPDGGGLAGLVLSLGGEEDGREIVSGAGGAFRLVTSAPALTLAVDDADWVTVREGFWDRTSSTDPVVVVAPVLELGGLVTEASGRPLEAALLSFQLPADFETGLGEVLDASQSRGWRAFSDGSGAFRFQRLPAVAGARLRASLDGYAVAFLAAPATSDLGLRVVLDRPTVPLTGSLSGRVVDAEGSGVPAARVGVGVASVLCDAAGDFVLDLSRAVTNERLTAVAAGFLPGELERPGQPGTGPDGALVTGWPDHVVVPLGPPALELAGRVVDHEGQPLANARIWLADPTAFAPIGRMPMRLENLLAGAPVPPRAVESIANLSEQDGDDYFDYDSSAPDQPSALWNWATSDETGRFTLPGLLKRSYRLDVMRPASTEIVTLGPFSAGATNIVLELPAPSLYARVEGIVRSRAGTPLAGVRVSSSARVFDVQSRIFGGSAAWRLSQSGPRTHTAEDGSFVLHDLPREGTRLQFSSDAIVPRGLSLAEFSDPRDLDVRVDARCHLRVELDEPAGEDAFGLTDADGGPLDVLFLTAGSFNAYTQAPLTNGRSETVSTSEAAAFVVFFAEGEVVARVPIEPVPGEVTLVR